MPILKFVQYIPTKDHIRFRRTLKVINQFAKTLIDEKTEAVLAGNGEKKKDIMSILGTSLAFFGPGVLGGQLNAPSILTTSPMSASARKNRAHEDDHRTKAWWRHVKSICRATCWQ